MSPVQIEAASQTLGDICAINPPKPNLRSLPDDTPVLFVPMAAVDDVTGTVANAQTRPLGEVRNKSYRIFAPGDVLFAKITPCMENGKSAIVPPIASGIGFGSTEFHVLRPRNGTDPRLIWHFVRQEALRREARENMTGSVGQARVPARFLETVQVQLPDDGGQDRLADLLDTVIAKTQRADDRLSQAHTAIERFRQAVLAAACSGRLTVGWRVENPHVVVVGPALRSIATGRKNRRSKEQPVDLELPDLPETYVVATVGDAAEILEYGTSKRCDASANQGVPVLRMGNIQDGRLVLDDLKYCQADKEIEHLMLEVGDVLFNRTNSPELVGKSAVFQGDDQVSFASYLIRVRFHPSIALPEFVNYWINSAWGRQWARLAKTDGVSQSNINGSKLALMPLPLPPVEEQRTIVHRASQMLRAARAIEKRIETAGQKLECSSQAVLAMAFRSELVSGASNIGERMTEQQMLSRDEVSA